MNMSEHPPTHPYPTHLVKQHTLPNGSLITIRPVKTEDEGLIQDFIRHLSSELKHLNYMESFRELPKKMLSELTQIDYKKKMTLIATLNDPHKETMIGMVHYMTEPNGLDCEFDMIVADAWQNKGVGSRLTDSLLRSAKENNIKHVKITILASNLGGFALANRFGFIASDSDDPTVKIVTKDITSI